MTRIAIAVVIVLALSTIWVYQLQLGASLAGTSKPSLPETRDDTAARENGEVVSGVDAGSAMESTVDGIAVDADAGTAVR